MRVTVALDDLEPLARRSSRRRGDGAAGRRRRCDVGTNVAGLRLERARSVASSLDLRGARVDEALEALGRYLDDASLAGPRQGADHPRPRHGRAARRGPVGGGAAIRS